MILKKDEMPGVLLSACIAVPAWLIGSHFPIIGGPILGILLGMILAYITRPAYLEKGLSFTSKRVLQFAIILLGFDMNLYQVIEVGAKTLLLMIFTLTAAFLSAFLLGKALKIERNINILIGIGTAICGGSAIAAAAPVIKAKDEDIAQAISTIFLFNVFAAFLFPTLGHVMQMTNYHFGLWAGTAINDTSSVVAAGYSYSVQSGDLAVIVKLTRTLMIIPVTLILALFSMRKDPSGHASEYRLSRIFPWFILGFAAASISSTFLPVPSDLIALLPRTGKFMIVMAMASIGLNTNLSKLLKNGARPILLGLGCWFVLSITSLVVQRWLL
ncbi:YeiH family putative sulfate export transporter [Anoxybacterium hadale]|uniref:YeiH family putative sulfate export transporter n=1 Tax=Anoxybacterium hadale TaxID=3408580 RepID=A0ACD1A6K0_9FIRM|nr:YeiH family putative sulfate export transporter [Clostridiales bacterium]